MTRKDYELLAQTLREDAAHLSHTTWDRFGVVDFDYTTADEWSRGAYDQWCTTVLAIGSALQADNPRFDAERFYSAAGFKGGAR